MANNKIKHTRLTNLSKGKSKKLGLMETLEQRTAGYMDGSRALPRQNENGEWVSPHMDKEVRAYEEFASKIWGELQIQEEEANVVLGKLIDSMAIVTQQLKVATAELAVLSANVENTEIIRKNGEEKLTDAQVKARRANEKAKRLAPLVQKINELKAAQDAAGEEFRELYNRIREEENSNRMICNRLKDRILQRLDAYWSAALRKHPKGASMPAVPSVEITCQAEKVYKKLHNALVKRATEAGFMQGEEEEE